MKNFEFLKKLNPNASDEEILKSIRGGTTNNINVPNQPIIKGDFIYSTGEDGKVTATVIEGSKTDTLRKAAEKKQETLDEKKEKQKDTHYARTDTRAHCTQAAHVRVHTDRGEKSMHRT